MKVELHINGRLNILLTPETNIERTVIEEMVSHAGKGKSVTMTVNDVVSDETFGAVISVEK